MSFPEVGTLRYDILVGVDWRHKLDIHDRGVLKPILEEGLDNVAINLVASIHTAAVTLSAPGFYQEIPVILARRAHRYARILEVMS